MRRSEAVSSGMTLPELLLGVLLLGLLAALGWGSISQCLARLEVEASARQLVLGLEQARDAAEASGAPCALPLSSHGWMAAEAAGLPACRSQDVTLPTAVRLSHNLPWPLRISSNGLVLDGGTLVLTADGTDLQRCVVIALPLGVVRLGKSTAAPGALPRSSDCVIDPSL